jgi:proline iminopeptidase
MAGELFAKPYNFHNELKKLSIPTLVIHGDCDVFPSVTAHAIHESISHSQYVLLKNCGHFPFVEVLGDLFTCLHTFLRSDNEPK